MLESILQNTDSLRDKRTAFHIIWDLSWNPPIVNGIWFCFHSAQLFSSLTNAKTCYMDCIQLLLMEGSMWFLLILTSFPQKTPALPKVFCRFGRILWEVPQGPAGVRQILQKQSPSILESLLQFSNFLSFSLLPNNSLQDISMSHWKSTWYVNQYIWEFRIKDWQFQWMQKSRM